MVVKLIQEDGYYKAPVCGITFEVGYIHDCINLIVDNRNINSIHLMNLNNEFTTTAASFTISLSSSLYNTTLRNKRIRSQRTAAFLLQTVKYNAHKMNSTNMLARV